MAQKADYYVLLGVNRNASQEEVRQAYLQAAQRLHPDKNKAVGETEIFLEVQQAYETLSNPKRRARYDETLPPEVSQSIPVRFQVHYSRPNLVRLEEPQMLYILLEVKPQTDEDNRPAPPLNVCLVLDRSTSMRGDKIDMVKASAIQVMRGLRQQDIMSVVTYSDRAEVLIPAGYAAGNSKLEAQIRMMQPDRGQAHRQAFGDSGRAGLGRRRHVRRGSGENRRVDRLPGADQGRGRRRRARDEAGVRRVRTVQRPLNRARRGESCFRRRRGVYRKIS